MQSQVSEPGIFLAGHINRRRASDAVRQKVNWEKKLEQIGCTYSK
jgi:hypothetical protein